MPICFYSLSVIRQSALSPPVKIVMAVQAAVMFALLAMDSANAMFIVPAAIIVGFNFGANLSLFPATAKEFFGLENFGVNYGLVYTAFGLGGFILPKVSQVVVAATGTFNVAYLTAAVLLLVSAGVSLITKAPQKVPVPPPLKA